MKIKVLALSLLLLAAPTARADDGDAEPANKGVLRSAVDNVSSAASELIVQAMGLVGIHYKYGGLTPETGFDCSGFVSHVFREAAGVILPHNAYQMSLVGRKVPTSQLQPGDLVFYNTLKRTFSHVGIYVGDDKFIHAPRKGKAVEVADMKDRYWLQRYEGARRVPQLEQPRDVPPQTTASLQDSPGPEIFSRLY